MWNPLRPVFKAEFRLFSLRALLGLLLTHQLLVALLEFRFLDRFTFSYFDFLPFDFFAAFACMIAWILLSSTMRRMTSVCPMVKIFDSR